MTADLPLAARLAQLQALAQQSAALVSAGQTEEAAPVFQQRMQSLRALVDAVLLLPEDARAEPLTLLQRHFSQLEQDIQPLAASLLQVREELSQLSKSNKAANAYGETRTLRT